MSRSLMPVRTPALARLVQSLDHQNRDRRSDRSQDAYLAELAAQARRLRQQQLKTEAKANRYVAGRHGLTTARAEILRARAQARAAQLQAQFLRTIDAMVAADGFDQAMAILRDLRRHRQPFYLLGPHIRG